MGWGGYYEYFYISNNARLDGGSVDRSRVKGYCPPLRRRLVLPGHLWKKSSTILVA